MSHSSLLIQFDNNSTRIFFKCYLAAPRPTLGHFRGSNLTIPLLITAYDSWFDLEANGSLVAGLGLKAQLTA